MLTALAVVAVLGVLFVAAVVATREGAVLVDAPPDVADVTLPAGVLVSSDLAAVRFGLALRGYRMSEVDAVLDRVQVELAERDARILELESGAAAVDAHPVAAADPVGSVDPMDRSDGSAGPVGGVAAAAGVTGLAVGAPTSPASPDEASTAAATGSDGPPSTWDDDLSEEHAPAGAVAVTDDSAFGAGSADSLDSTGSTGSSDLDATAVSSERDTTGASSGDEGADQNDQTDPADPADPADPPPGPDSGAAWADEEATGWAFDEGGAAAAAAHPGLDDDWGMPQVGDLEPAAADLPDAHEPDVAAAPSPGSDDAHGTGGTGGTGSAADPGVADQPSVVTSRPSAVGAAGEPLSSAPLVAPPAVTHDAGPHDAGPHDPAPRDAAPHHAPQGAQDSTPAPGATEADAPRDAEPVPPVRSGSGDVTDEAGSDAPDERPTT